MTTPTSTALSAPPVRFSTGQRVGLVLAALLGLADCTALFSVAAAGADVGAQDGPPVGVLVVTTALGVLTVVGVVLAWVRRSRGLVRGVAGMRILSVVLGLPAFFVDVPAPVKLLTALFVLVSLVAVVLVLTPARRSSPVLD